MNRLLAIVLAASVSVPALAAGNAESGKQKSQVCAACHGPDGNHPTTPDFPRLAGQHPDYLLKALHDYKSGARKNPRQPRFLEDRRHCSRTRTSITARPGPFATDALYASPSQKRG